MDYLLAIFHLIELGSPILFLSSLKLSNSLFPINNNTTSDKSNAWVLFLHVMRYLSFILLNVNSILKTSKTSTNSSKNMYVFFVHVMP